MRMSMFLVKLVLKILILVSFFMGSDTGLSVLILRRFLYMYVSISVFWLLLVTI